MNRTKIEWTDFTWNPITGCRNGCDFCYARKLAEGRLKGRYGYPAVDPFKPTFHKERLTEPNAVNKPSRIFTISMGDMFSFGVERGWIHAIMDVIRYTPHHTFQVLTKSPERMTVVLGPDFELPSNLYMGVSVSSDNNQFRLDVLHAQLDMLPGKPKRFVSFEPLLGSIDSRNVDWERLDWVIVGAETGNRKGKIKPDPRWIVDILGHTGFYGIPIFMKNNLDYPIKFQLFPGEEKSSLTYRTFINKSNKINKL